jgi:hypothetical protein
MPPRTTDAAACASCAAPFPRSPTPNVCMVQEVGNYWPGSSTDRLPSCPARNCSAYTGVGGRKTEAPDTTLVVTTVSAAAFPALAPVAPAVAPGACCPAATWSPAANAGHVSSGTLDPCGACGNAAPRRPCGAVVTLHGHRPSVQRSRRAVRQRVYAAHRRAGIKSPQQLSP